MRVRFKPSRFKLRRVAKKVCQFVLGTIFGMPEATLFTLTEKEAKTGFCIFGGAGFGKTRLLQQLLRELTLQGEGWTWIAPENDAGEELLAFLTYHHKELGLRRDQIYYLQPDEAPIAFDPFEYPIDPNDPHPNSDHKYHCWFHSRIKDLVLIITRKQGETEDDAQKMVRLKRWLFNVLYAVGIRQADGSHLTLNDAIALLTPSHPEHERLYQRVQPFLDHAVRADFEKLRSTKDQRKQEDWVESTINRLREIDSPTMRLVFGGYGKSFDFKSLILNRGILIASIGKTNFYHPDEAQVYAALLIRKINDVVRTIPKQERVRHWLTIDEAQNFLGEDLVNMLKECRKYLLHIGLCVQQLDNLQKREIDLVPTVLGICSMRVTFRQKFHEHADIIAKSLCFPLFVFKELIHTVERHGGYEWVTVLSRNFSRSQSSSLSLSAGQSRSSSRGRSEGKSDAVNNSLTHGKSEGTSITASRGNSFMEGRSVTFSQGESDSLSNTKANSSGTTDSHQTSRGTSLTDSHNQGTSLTTPPNARRHTQGRSEARNSGTAENQNSSSGTSLTNSSSHSVTTGTSKQRSRAKGASKQEGNNESLAVGSNGSHSRSKSVGHSRTRSSSVSESQSHGTMSSVTVGQVDGETKGFSLAPSPLAIVERHEQPTGRLEKSVPDQIAEHTQTIMTLPPQYCLVALDTDQKAFVMRVANVLDPFEERGCTPRYREAMINAFKQWMYARHDCYVLPNHNPPVPPRQSSKGPGLT